MAIIRYRIEETGQIIVCNNDKKPWLDHMVERVNEVTKDKVELEDVGEDWIQFRSSTNRDKLYSLFLQ